MGGSEILGRSGFAREPKLPVPIRAREGSAGFGTSADRVEAVTAKGKRILPPTRDLCGNWGGKARAEHGAQGLMRGVDGFAVTKLFQRNCRIGRIEADQDRRLQ